MDNFDSWELFIIAIMRSNEPINGSYKSVGMFSPIPTPTLARKPWTERKVYLKTDKNIDWKLSNTLFGRINELYGKYEQKPPTTIQANGSSNNGGNLGDTDYRSYSII